MMGRGRGSSCSLLVGTQHLLDLGFDLVDEVGHVEECACCCVQV